MKLTITGCVYSFNFIITPKPNVNSLHGIVAYTSTFVNIYENIHQFLSSIERDEQERKLVPFFLRHGVYPTDRQTGGRRDTGPTLYACRREERGQRQMHTLVEQIRRRLALDSVCAAHQRPTKTTLMQRLWCSVGDVITYGARRAGAAGQTRTYVRTHRESGERGWAVGARDVRSQTF